MLGDSKSHHVTVVDDDPITTKVVRFLLEDEGYTTTILHSGQRVIETAIGQDTDLIILDVNLPDFDGFTLTRRLRARGYAGAIILLTGRDAVADKVEGFRHGADDYLTKPYEPRELLIRIESIIRRTSQVSKQASAQGILRVGDAELSLGELTYRSDAVESVILTPTEMKLLEALMRNSWLVVSHETLNEQVWGYDFVGDTNRVTVYIRRLRHKIEPDPRHPRYLHTVRGGGYVFRGEDDSNQLDRLLTSSSAAVPDNTIHSADHPF